MVAILSAILAYRFLLEAVLGPHVLTKKTVTAYVLYCLLPWHGSVDGRNFGCNTQESGSTEK